MKNQNLAFIASISVILFFVNHSIILDYAFSDAYEFIWSGHHDKNFINTFIQGGRPLYGWLNTLVFGSWIDEISELKYVRLMSLVTIILLAFQLFHFLVKFCNWKKFESAALALLIVLLPSFTVYSGWSVTYEIPIALNLSFFAGAIFIQFIEKDFKSYWRLGLSIVLIITALTLYQSAATFYFVPFVIRHLTRKESFYKEVLFLGILTLVSFVAYFFLFKGFLHYSEVGSLDRSGVDFVYFPKKFLFFYWTELLTIVQGNFHLVTGNGLSYIGLILLAGFFFFLIRKGKKDRVNWGRFFFFILIIPLAYFPNLLSVDDWMSSRTIVTSASIVLILQFVFIRSVLIPKLRVPVTVVMIFVFVLGSYYNQNLALAGLQAQEYRVVSIIIDEMDFRDENKIVIVLNKRTASMDFGYLKRTKSDELGILSTAIEWVPKPMLQQMLAERGLDTEGVEFEVHQESTEFYEREGLHLNFEEEFQKILE